MNLGDIMKTIEDVNLNNKKVVVRCDFNVPIKNGVIEDNTKIVRSLKTIKYLIDHNCRVVLLSHLGRIKAEEDKAENTLLPVRNELEQLLGMPVTFVSDYSNPELDKSARVILLENTRYTDIPKRTESDNDPNLAKMYAKFGDIFVFDAFGSAHRRHSSTSGLVALLPTYIGYLVQEELNNLNKVVNHENPFAVVMGGAKVDDKLPIIKNLLPSCDYLLLGGGIANSFLKAQGYNIGKSLATNDEKILVDLRCLIELYKDKIFLPTDVIVLNNGNIYEKNIDSLSDDDCIYDIGSKTANKYGSIIKSSKTIFANGTVGLCEDDRFKLGQTKLFEAMQKTPNVVIGGGDTVSATRNLGFEEDFTLSSGGGASLEYLANGSLPVLDDIQRVRHL